MSPSPRGAGLRIKPRRVLAPAVLLWAASLAAPGAALDEATHRASALSPKELLERLQRVELDPANSFQVNELYLRREAVRLTLRHGSLVFLEPVDGRVTGAVFEGAGEILVLPPDLPERQQMAKFTGSPILAETFDSLYLRFSEDTYAALREQLPARGRPRHAPEVLERWRGRVGELNGAHSVRLLLNLLSEKPAGYFYASVTGERLGRFDAVVDERRAERLLVGQLRAAGPAAGGAGDEVFYDVWTSFSPGEQPPAEEPARGLAYRIDTTILPTYELEATCDVELDLSDAHQQVLLFELSRRLTVVEVAEVSGEETQPLEFFQNATLTAEEALHRGTDVLAVVLPAPHPSAKAEEPLGISPASRLGAGPAGARRRLRFRYRGQVITALGNGVFFVGARENWYPRVGAYVPAQYELRFRYPRRLELVATGAREESREVGEWKESVWVSEGPVPIAGFNLGEYESLSVERGAVRVSVYGNREVEPMLLARVQRPPPPPPPRRRGSRLADVAPPTPTLLAPPSEQAARMAQDVGCAVEVFSELFGPFPYSELKVTQIPGRFGQGYPGLLYVSTLSFLEPGDLMRLGLRERSQEHFLEIVPAHETAHQWWGNWVQLPRYRDQWLAESLAAYSSLLYLEKEKGGETARRWLERYREDLLAPMASGQAESQGMSADASGPLALGARLDSSRSPTGYSTLVYSKGPWVIHMLRELFRHPESRSDAAFLGVLRGLAERSDAPLTTDEFIRRLEAALPAGADVEGTGKLDWFFEQWVYNTGIPHYKLRWDARAEGAAWRVEGSIEPSEVSEVFAMPLTVWARRGREWSQLGAVVVTGSRVEFRFPLEWKPDEVRLDIHGAVLAVYE